MLDGGQRSSAEVFGSFSPCGQALLAETALGLMAVMVSVRQLWLRRQYPTVSIPMTVTHTMGGLARDVARHFALGRQTYSHIAHMETLMRADRFFGVSLLLLQQTEASFLAASFWPVVLWSPSSSSPTSGCVTQHGCPQRRKLAALQGVQAPHPALAVPKTWALDLTALDVGMAWA